MAIRDLRCGLSLWVAVVFLISGCASWDVSRGDRAAAKQDWDTAVLRYRSAVQRGRNDAELTAKLRQAESAAFAVHRGTGESALRSGNYDLAVTELEAALRFGRDAGVSALLREARDRKRRQDAANSFAQARQLEQEGDLLAEQNAYWQAASLDSTLSEPAREPLRDIAARVAEARQIAVQAQRALDRLDLRAAEQIAEDALIVHPRDATALAVQAGVRAERDARDLERSALDADDRDELEAAVTAARQAQSLRRTPSRDVLVQRLERRAQEKFGRRAGRAFRERSWNDAIRLYELARQYGGNVYAFDGELRSARYEQAIEQGDLHERDCRLKTAAAWYKIANDLRPSDVLGKKAYQYGSGLYDDFNRPKHCAGVSLQVLSS